MKGKKLSIIAILFAFAASLASCEGLGDLGGLEFVHEHTYATDYSFDETHHWLDSTCGHPQAVNKVAHSYGDWEVVTKATDLAEGLEKRSCRDCGYIQNKKIDQLPHIHDYERSVFTVATCDEPGEYLLVCSGCGDEQFEEIPKLGHSFETLSSTSSCKEAGEKSVRCTICGYEEKQATPKEPHQITTEHKDPTCKDPGYDKQICSVCKEVIKETVLPVSHSFGEWKVIKEATESTKGVQKRTCTTCGVSETADIPVLAHTHKFVDGKCSICGYSLNECTHEETKEKLLDIRDYGGCDHIISFLVCECGEKTILKTFKSNPVSDSTPITFIDSNGNKADEAYKFTCSKCKFVIDIGLYKTVDQCTTVWDYIGKIYYDSEFILDFTMHEESENHYYTRGTKKLPSSICGGYREIETCSKCGNVATTSFNIDACDMSIVSSIDGTTIYQCRKCGAQYIEAVEEVINGCVINSTITKSLYQNNELICEYEDYTCTMNHEIKYETTNYKNCEGDSYSYKIYCTKCDEVLSNGTASGHLYWETTKQFDTACGPLCIHESSCLLCGNYKDVYHTGSCDFAISENKYETSGGMQYKTIYTCKKCGLQIRYTMIESYKTCDYSRELEVYITQDGKQIFKQNYSCSETSHQTYDWTYTPITDNCEDGVLAEASCNRCGEKISRIMYGHTMGQEEISVYKETNGKYSGYIYKQYCMACGKLIWIDAFKYEYSYSTSKSIIDGVEHTYENFFFKEIGLTLSIDTVVLSKKDCLADCMGVIRYYFDDELYEEIISYDTHEMHDLVEDKTFDGDTCLDGVQVHSYCKDCDYSTYDKYYEHLMTKECVNLGKTKHGKVAVNREYCMLCDTVFDISIALDDYSCLKEPKESTKTMNGKKYTVYTYTCECGLIVTAYENVEKVTSCVTNRNIILVISISGKEVFNEAFTKTEAEHEFETNYSQTENCNLGYQVITTCKKCDYYDSSYYMGHMYDSQSFTIDSIHGEIGLSMEYCSVCHETSNAYIKNWNCKTTSSKKIRIINGKSHEGTLYSCECGFEYFSYLETSQNGCTLEITEVTVYYYKQEVIVETIQHSEKENHNYDTRVEYLTDDHTCEAGYTLYRTCKTCGAYDEYTGKDHYVNPDNIYFTDYDICYLMIYGGKCQVCGMNAILYAEFKCYFQEDGNGDVKTALCQECGLTRVREKGKVITVGCRKYEYWKVTYSIGSLVIYEGYTQNIDEIHEYYASDIKYQGTTCEDGWEAVIRCKNCEYYSYNSGHGHYATKNSTVVYSGESECGPIIYEEYPCLICEEVAYSNISYSCDYFNYSSENKTTDEDGKTHYEYTNTCALGCGFSYVVREDRYREEGTCKQVYTSTRTYYLNKKEICSTKNVETFYYHSYEESPELKNDSCEDGYYVYCVCKICGESYSSYRTGHYRMESHEVVIPVGCGNITLKESQCTLCKAKTANSMYPEYSCSMEYDTKTETVDGKTVRTVTYTCKKCSAKISYIYTYTMIEKCYARIDVEIIVEYEGNVKYTGSYYYHDTVHNYGEKEIKFNGATCDLGWVITRTCKNCRHEDYESGSGHILNEYILNVNYDGICDGLSIRGEKCDYCDFIKIEDLNGDCVFETVKEESSEYVDDNGISHEIQIQKCKNCDLVISWDTTQILHHMLYVNAIEIVITYQGKEICKGYVIE